MDLLGRDSVSSSFAKFFKFKKYVQLETSKNNQIGEIQSVLSFDDRIFLSDDEENLFVYSDKGKLINKLSRGRAPGQYLDLFDIQFDYKKKELYVWSLVNKTMYIYSQNGNFKRSFKLNIPIVKFIVVDDRNIACYTNYAANDVSKASDDEYYQLFLLRKETDSWNVLSKEFTFPSKLANHITYAYGSSNFCRSEQDIFFMSPFESCVYKLKEKFGEGVEEYRKFDFGRNSMPDDFIRKEGIVNLFEKLNREQYISGWGNFFINNHVICFTVMLNGIDKLVIHDMKDTNTYVYTKLKDSANELPVHLVASFGSEQALVSVVNTYEIKKSSFNDKCCLGAKLAKEVSEFDNPILIFYESL